MFWWHVTCIDHGNVAAFDPESLLDVFLEFAAFINIEQSFVNVFVITALSVKNVKQAFSVFDCSTNLYDTE